MNTYAPTKQIKFYDFTPQSREGAFFLGASGLSFHSETGYMLGIALPRCIFLLRKYCHATITPHFLKTYKFPRWFASRFPQLKYFKKPIAAMSHVIFFILRFFIYFRSTSLMTHSEKSILEGLAPPSVAIWGYPMRPEVLQGKPPNEDRTTMKRVLHNCFSATIWVALRFG